MTDADLEQEIDSVWQRIRAWAEQALVDRRPVPTLQRGTINYIADVVPGSIGRTSAEGTSNSSRTHRAEVAKVWKALREHGETGTPPSVLYFTPALMVAALPEVEHIGDGVIRLVATGPRPESVPLTPTTVPAEAHRVEGYGVRTSKEERTATRREAQLVTDYHAYIFGRAELRRRRYGQLVCDIFAVDRLQLIEAKADASRDSVRMAIGQLFDYRRYETEPVALAVLLPEHPGSDLVELLDSVGIALIWRDGAEFKDNRDGEFV